jgi:replication initiation and membrane attachment protein
MKSIKAKDYISVHLQSVITEQDLQWIIEFYQPLIGPIATSLYSTLKQLALNEDFFEVFTYQQLLNLLQTQEHQTQQGRMALEALGLLRTYHDVFKDSSIYTFALFAPKNPNDFMDDPLLSGLLKQYTDEKYLKILEKKYQVLPLDYQEEISASFAEVFHADLSNPTFAIAPRTKLKGRAIHDIRNTLDVELFKNHLLKLADIDLQHYNLSLLDQILSIGQLTGIDEIALAEACVQAYNPVERRFDIDRVTTYAMNERKLPFLKSRIKKNTLLTGSSDQVALINQMEQLNPTDFLQLKQHGAEPSLSDIKLVRTLAIDMKLSFPVINALIHHVLQQQNNTLPRAYTEKLAASIGREGLTTALDTMDYFVRVITPKSYPKPSQSKAKAPTSIPTQTENEDEINALLESMKHLK